jgi:hypothetical protein
VRAGIKTPRYECRFEQWLPVVMIGAPHLQQPGSVLMRRSSRLEHVGGQPGNAAAGTNEPFASEQATSVSGANDRMKDKRAT